MGLIGLTEQLIFACFLVLITIFCTMRGLHYGILLAMFTGSTQVTLIKSMGAIPLITMDRLVWPIVVLFFALAWKRGKTKKLSPDAVEYALFSVLIVIAGSMYFFDTSFKAWGNSDIEKVRLRPFLSGFIYPFLAYYMTRRVIRSQAQVRSFLVGIGGAMAYFVVTGLGEASGEHWLVFPKVILNSKEGIHFGHVRGPFLNASHYGLALSMGLPIVLWLFFTERRRISLFWCAIATLAVVPLVFTYQRSAWLGAAVALSAVAMAWRRRRVILLGGIALAAALGLLVLTGTVAEEKLTGRLHNQTTVEFRVEMMKRSLALIRENPVTGVGFYRFSEAAREIVEASNVSHNTPLTLFVELGLLGFVPYCGAFIFLFLKSMNVYLGQPRYRPVITVMWGSTAAYLVTWFVGDLRMVAYANIFLFALWGMVLEQIRKQPACREERVSVNRIVSFA